jgi:hypothetical protein
MTGGKIDFSVWTPRRDRRPRGVNMRAIRGCRRSPEAVQAQVVRPPFISVAMNETPSASINAGMSQK